MIQRLPGNLDIETLARKQKTRLAERQRRFFERLDSGATVDHLEEPISDPRPPADDDVLYLSIAEMFVRRDAAEWKASDFVVGLSAMIVPAPPDPSTTLTFFVSPETIRNSAVTVPSGQVVSDVPIAGIQSSLASSLDLSLLVLRVTRNRGTQRILETVDSMIPGIDYATDLLGSMSWADAILDRLEVLAHSRDGECVFAATCRQVERKLPSATRYSTFLGADLRSNRGSTRLVRSVRNGRLWDGVDDSTATPCRHQEFVLVRLGRRIEKAQPVSIHQLRRNRASGGNAYRLDKGTTEVDYVAEQERLRKIRRLTGLYGQKRMQWRPLVTPIALEVAKDLIPLVESESHSISREFQEALTLMKDGLRYQLGIEMPGVRVRGNETDLPDGTYIIMINEIPLVSGNVALDRSLANATVDRLNALGIKGKEAVNPANGNECAWVEQADYQRVKDSGLRLWSAAEYMILHLSSVLRKNAVEFLGMRSVADLVRARSDSYEAICASRRGLPSFASVLAILVEEEVPLNSMDRICARYLELAPTGRPLYEIVEEIRCLDGLREKLRYNESEITVYRLTQRAVESIKAGIHRFGETLLLALEPEPTQDLLTAVRNEVGNLAPTDPNPFVVVDDWRLRRPVRKLIELEFPHLRVLATRELSDLPSEAIKEVAVIDYEPTKPSPRKRGRK